MLRNYAVTAWRNLLRYRLYSAVNIAGLAVGMACAIVALLFIRYEMGYDRFFGTADRLYRLAAHERRADRENKRLVLSQAMIDALRQRYARIERGTTLLRMPIAQNKAQVAAGGVVAHEDNGRLVLADEHFLAVFGLPLLAGDARAALSEPNSVVISRSMARKYFGDQDPLGQTLRVPGQNVAAAVTGVMADMPDNAHCQFDFVFSRQQGIHESYYQFSLVYFYFTLAPGAAAADLRHQLDAFVADFAGLESIRNEPGARFDLVLQPVVDIHLHSDFAGEWKANRDVDDLYLFGAVAGLVLLIACVNFVNLATARAADRAREVGVRKAVGAHRGRLVGQFMGEAVCCSGAALLLALALVDLAVEPFNAFAATGIDAHYWREWPLLGGAAALALLVGAVSGFYPALVLSAFPAEQVLKGRGARSPGGVLLRRALVVLQFAVSTALIIAAGVIYGQMEYAKDKRLGAGGDQLLVVEGGLSQWTLDAFKNELGKQRGVLGVSGVSTAPGAERTFGVSEYRPLDDPEAGALASATLFVDEDFIEVAGVELLAGRAYDAERDGEGPVFLINETAARQWGWADPVGQTLEVKHFREVRQGKVIGVVRDFHLRSLHHRIEPLVLCPHSQQIPFATVYHALAKVGGDDLASTVAATEAVWRSFAPDDYFQYGFVDERFERLYRAEMRQLRVFGGFAALAVFVACLGAYGLMAFSAQRRTKEIGIRKSLGASAADVVWLLTRETGLLVVAANCIAWPVGYWAMRGWLEGFAYQAQWGPGVFALCGGAVLLVAWFAVGGQAWRAARTNPVEALRYE